MNHRFLLFGSLVASSTIILLSSPISAELFFSNRPHIPQIVQQPNVSDLIAVDDRPLDRKERPDWANFFDSAEAQGTIVILDQRGDTQQLWVYGQERADRAYSPASTFKIPHSLFALNAGIVRDEFQVFDWDGVERDFAPHNQDQDLRSAMRNSTVWVYEMFANAIGEAKAREYLTQIDYGNADPSTSKGAYWIDGALAISAQEQIYFLQKLYQNELPFRVEHQRLVKDIMIIEAEQNWILRAKTGWEGRWGWWVGWVEWPTGPVFFALNIDTPNRLDDLSKREEITRAILQSVDALPEQENGSNDLPSDVGFTAPAQHPCLDYFKSSTKPAMKELTTTIDIEASPQTIWQILTDFSAFEQWNPFIQAISGRAVQGTKLKVYIQPPGGQGMTFKPTVLVAEPEQELTWLGHFLIPGLFDGEHRFCLEPLGDNRTQFTQSEQFGVLLVPLLAKDLDTKVRQGFEAMNQALKTQAESLM